MTRPFGLPAREPAPPPMMTREDAARLAAILSVLALALLAAAALWGIRS